MKRIALLSLVFLAFATQLRAAEIGKVPWNNQNVDVLRAADKAAVAKFVNSNRPSDWVDDVPLYSVVDFGWGAIGGGKYDLLVLLDVSGRGWSNTLLIFMRNDAGGVKTQVIYGWKIGNLKDTVHDLNGSGADELIITKEMSLSGLWSPLRSMPAWPTVYRLKGTEYVEASRDFPNFYDHEILPNLEREIAEANAKLATEPFQQETIASDEMEKYKILRVLGREPAAGLKQAYNWMNSADPQLLQCAIATFADIGGHERELNEAQRALPAAIKRQMAARQNKS